MKSFIKKGFAVLVALVILSYQSVSAFEILGHEFHIIGTKAWRDARHLKKQQKEPEPMVQTVEEWQQLATNIKMEHRPSIPYKEEVDEKMVEKWPIPTYFEAYNIAPGTREINLERIKTIKNVRSQGVVSPNFRYMAYTEAYYYPSNLEVISAFFIYPLDMLKGKKQRVEQADIFSGAKKTPLISSSIEIIRQNLFSLLTIVDWSKDSSRVLLSEKIGSGKNGIYKTYTWLYSFNSEGVEKVRYDRLNDLVKNYWFQKEKMNLNTIRWDVKPLGFLASDENIIVCKAFTYDDKLKEAVFLGYWEINSQTGEINLLDESKDAQFAISANGLILVQRLP